MNEVQNLGKKGLTPSHEFRRPFGRVLVAINYSAVNYEGHFCSQHDLNLLKLTFAGTSGHTKIGTGAKHRSGFCVVS